MPVKKQSSMNNEKISTVKIVRETRKVSDAVKDNLKDFIRRKKVISEALKECELTIPQISQKTGMPLDETVYYVASMVKFGLLQTSKIDDNDEYFYYKLKKNE